MYLLNLLLGSLPLLALASPPALSPRSLYYDTQTNIYLTDSANNEQIYTGVSCSLYDEGNSLIEAVTGGNNGCQLTIPGCNGKTCPSIFSLQISKDSYYNVKITSLTIDDLKNLKVQLTSKLENTATVSELRVVLTWGNNVDDLDSYLIVPPKGKDQVPCKLSYSKMMCDSAVLDVDDLKDYGPETVTIQNPHPGVYSYFVNIYTNNHCFDGGISANVEIWSGKDGGRIANIDQPEENPIDSCTGNRETNTCHKYWHVFDFDASTNEFTWVNKMVPYDDFLAVSQGTAAAASGNSYLPAVDPCSCQVHSDSDWISKISDASTSFYEALMGPAGVATKAMCFDEIQTQYDNAFRTSTVSSAPAFAKDLAQKVGLKFEARYEQAEKLRDEAEDYYGEETLNSSPPDAFCMDQCNSCKYDSSFFSEVDRTKYGVRWGARADEENTAARVESEDVVQRLGDYMVHPVTGTYVVDPSTKWTFMGTEEGVMMMAPHGVGSEAKCRSYDPRIRPWYSEGYMRAKNLVVVIDGSSAVTDDDLLSLKQGALAVIGTLAAGDTANVVIARSSSHNVPGDDMADLTYRNCHGGQMLRTGVVNKALLSRFVDEAARSTGSGGAADLAAAITVAQNLISAQRDVSSAYPTIDSSDVIVVLAASYSDLSTGFGALKAELEPPATWFLHTLGSDQVASESFDRAEVMAPQDAGFSPARYYTLPALATNRDTFASAFYVDNSGLGMITSIVSPIVVDGAIRAMVGTDVMVQELVADLLFEKDFSSSYSFIVDSAGQTVWHPALPAPQDGAVEPVNILDLEISNGFKNNVVAGLIAGESGSWSGTVAMAVPRGDATYAGFNQVTREVTFAWEPIVRTPFRIGVVLTAEDEAGEDLSSPPISAQDCVELGDCDVYHMLDSSDARCGNSVSNGMIKGVSSAFYAASAFEGPSEWLQRAEGRKDITKLVRANTCSAGMGGYIPSFDYGVGNLKDAVINDNMLLRGDVDRCWKDNGGGSVVWSYFGSSNGLFRIMPATSARKKYDPTKRSWYVGAVSNVDVVGGWGVTMSTPYLDSSGAGEVVTVSKVVGGSGGGSDVAGVSGADFTLAGLRSMLASTVCGETNVVCMLMDETGHLVYHPDFADSDQADENVFLSVKAREIADALVEEGMMMQNTCMDYAAGKLKTSYQLSADIGASGGELGCGTYSISRVGDSNVYLVGVSSNGCESGKRGEHVECAVCNLENCAKWEMEMQSVLLCQPCECTVKYDSCAGGYGEEDGSVVACPAAPPPLFDDLCPAFTALTDDDGNSFSAAAAVWGAGGARLLVVAVVGFVAEWF